MLDYELVNRYINNVLTQYRESNNLLHLIRTYGREVEKAYQAIEVIPDAFNLETSTGDQLTIIGKWLGFPRCHSVCETPPVYGFNCDNDPTNTVYAGFCDDNATWAACVTASVSQICIVDDEIYRNCLKSRVYQYLAKYDMISLESCAKLLLGDESRVALSGNGKVVLTISKEFSASEKALLKVFARVLPVAPGIEIYYSYVYENIAGFGEGYVGFCRDGRDRALGTDTNDIIVTDTGAGLYVNPPSVDYILTDDSDIITTDSGDRLITDDTEILGQWLCSFPANSYGCN